MAALERNCYCCGEDVLLERDTREQHADADQKPTGNRKERVPSSSGLAIVLQCPLLAEPNRVPADKGEMWFARA